MSDAGDGEGGDDGIHPLDRDYTKPVPQPSWKISLGKSIFMKLGVLGFAAGGLVLLLGIVLSQFGKNNRAFETMAGNAHRLGMWSILFGGTCVVVAMQTRADKPQRTRRPWNAANEVLEYRIVAIQGGRVISLQEWKYALEEFDDLVPAQLTADCFSPEMEDVYLVIGDVVLAVMRWDATREGVINMRVRRCDLVKVKQRCFRLLEFLEAGLIDVSNETFG